jgi:beta-glucanase (GH16 family)
VVINLLPLVLKLKKMLIKNIKTLCLSVFLFLVISNDQLYAQNFDELVWSDEFESEGLPDSRFWSYDLGSGQNGWGNSEVQSYTNASENARVSGGRLIIDAIKRNGVWTSARIKTQGKFNFKYGRIEFRARIPKGSGTWPALWLLGESITSKGWPACGEIDVMEHVGKVHGEVHGSLHTPSSHGATINTGKINVPDISENYHLYVAEWTPDAIKFYVDDKLYYTYAPSVKNSSTWPFEESFIIINLAMGGEFGSDPKFETNGLKNGIDPALNSARMEVDYIRVYQSFKEIRITGERFVAPSTSSYSYKANVLKNANYSWSVPGGAEIVSGQGTSTINVNWGDNEGDLKLKISYEGNDYEQVLPVRKIIKPVGETYNINGFEGKDLGKWSSSGGDFELLNEENALRINYNISNPGDLPGVAFSLENPLNLTDHTHFFISIKTANKSGTVMARVDLEDTDGKVTSGNSVFLIYPIIDDNEYFLYKYDFNSMFGSGNNNINAQRVRRIRFLINYGIFGAPGQDSLWINSIFVASKIDNSPNRPSHLTIDSKTGNAFTFKWKNNAPDAEYFQIFSATDNENFTVLSSNIEGSKTSFQQEIDINRPVYFKMKVYNAFGGSEFSNVISSEDVITGAYAYAMEPFQIFPQPANNRFTIAFSDAATIQEIWLLDISGKKLLPEWKLNDNICHVDLERLQPKRGVYVVYILTPSKIITNKIILI